MRKILLIIKREYLTRVRTKGFIIGTIIVPLIGLGSILLVVFLVGHTATQSLRIVIVDNSGSLAPAIVRGLDGKLADGQPQFAVEETVIAPGFARRRAAGPARAHQSAKNSTPTS